jgi:uncharacterized protein with LGFP repeats
VQFAKQRPVAQGVAVIDDPCLGELRNDESEAAVTAIDDKRRQLPWLGNPVDEGAGSAEMDLGDGRGRARDYENGSIYGTPQAGAHEVHGAILGLRASMGSSARGRAIR